jgi:hypothetical protein
MKNRNKSGKHPEIKRHDGKESAAAASFHEQRLSAEHDYEVGREAANVPQGNYEYEQMVAEDANFNTNRMIAEAAYYISEGRGFAPGHADADWLRAEAEVEKALRGAAPSSVRPLDAEGIAVAPTAAH